MLFRLVFWGWQSSQLSPPFSVNRISTCTHQLLAVRRYYAYWRCAHLCAIEWYDVVLRGMMRNE